jgi:hypothetical protein
MRNLNLHAGGSLQTREQIAALNYPAPKGARHVVRPFIEDLELLTATFDDFGYRVTDEGVGVVFDKDNLARQFFGAIEVRPKALVGEYLPADERSIVVGIRGSADQSLPRQLCAGTNTFVCSNLCFHSNLVNVSTKQTLFIDQRITGLFRDAISLLPQEVERDNKRIEAYKNYALSGPKGDAILIELVRRNILNASDLPTAIAEWDKPAHEAHAAHGKTAYQLLQACTEAIKPRGDGNRAYIPGAWNRGLPLIQFLDVGVGLTTLH